MKTDAFFKAYEGYMNDAKILYDAEAAAYGNEEADRENARKILNNGISLLNETDYKHKFKSYPEAQANVLHGVAQASMYLGDYNQALSYLEEASIYNPEDISIYRDLTIARLDAEKKTVIF